MRELEAQFEQFVGQEAEPPRVARYAVDEAMIRNWVEAHDDLNPVYVDAEAARATGRSGVICPPAMVTTWIMQGYRRWRAVQRQQEQGVVEDHAYARLLALLADHGFTSVVATAQEQEYLRELQPGDRVTCHLTIESVSPVKRTGLGLGCFVTLRKHYLDQRGELVMDERFVMLRFDPSTQEAAA